VRALVTNSGELLAQRARHGPRRLRVGIEVSLLGDSGSRATISGPTTQGLLSRGP
jgi:hypothetical protein